MKTISAILFRGLTTEEVQQYHQKISGKLVHYPPRTEVLHLNRCPRCAGFILEGGLSLTRCSEDGQRQIVINRLGAGAVFGINKLLAPTAICADMAITTAETTLYLFDGTAALREPPLVVNLLAALSQRNLELAKRIMLLGQGSLRQRLLVYLHSLTDNLLPMSKTALADYLVADRAALGRVFHELEQDGILECRGRSFTWKIPPDEIVDIGITY